MEPVESRNRINEVQRNADLENISDTALETLITSEETKQYLFPSERVVVDTVPYQPIKTNVPILRGPNGSTIVFSDVRNASGAYTGLLSFGTLYRVKQPSFQYTVELYGKDETSLGNHIMSHLKNLIEQVDGETYMVFYLEKHIQIENVDKALEGCGIKRTFVRDPVTSKILFTEQFLYEKSVK